MAPQPTAPTKAADGSPRRGALLSSTSWAPSEHLGFDEWLKVGQRFGAVGRGIGWWIGDWLRYGNLRWGERYPRASRITGYDVQTLMNMTYVAGRFGECRRREALSWSHHAEIAALDRDEQELWLDRAEAHRLSVRCLRLEVRSARRASTIGRDSPRVTQRRSTAAHPSLETLCPRCLQPVAMVRDIEHNDDEPSVDALGADAHQAERRPTSANGNITASLPQVSEAAIQMESRE